MFKNVELNSRLCELFHTITWHIFQVVNQIKCHLISTGAHTFIFQKEITIICDVFDIDIFFAFPRMKCDSSAIPMTTKWKKKKKRQ